MDEITPPLNPALSLHLARALDVIGLNTDTVKKRRHAYLCTEQMENVLARLTGENRTSYHFGSQTEGATTPGLESDIDTLHCDHNFNVIEDFADWRRGKTNLLMLQEDTAPGYCRLQLLRRDLPIGRKKLPKSTSTSNYTYDDKGRVLLENSSCHSTRLRRHGPAESEYGRLEIMDYDRVIALPCKTWPRQARKFTRRRRRHGWPSTRLLEEATSHGIFLVPVGHRLSKTAHLEWRISASLAERCLMFSLNIVHIKCLVVLKMLMKSFVEPRIQNCISSYHCKTALLYCTENTEHGFWREDNLLQCITLCLETLQNWIADGFCPQIIIRKENLFAGKKTVENRELLLSIFDYLIDSYDGILLLIDVDNLGLRLQLSINTDPSYVPLMDSSISESLVGGFERDKQLILNRVILMYKVDKYNNEDHISTMRAVHRDIFKLHGMIEGSNKHERQVVESFIMFLSCWLGSLIASFSLANNMEIPRKAIQLICIAAKDDVSSMLKLASVFYCDGKFEMAAEVLQRVEDHVRMNAMQVTCWCYGHYYCENYDFCRIINIVGGEKVRARLFAHCVRFSPQEIHCAPPGLHFELRRANGDDMEHGDPSWDRWMMMGIADCLPYLHYLQYLTYKQLENGNRQKRSLRNIERCAREDDFIYHRETAWNLLGQCWESEQKHDAAKACYLESLEIRPRFNAANIHMQNLGVADPAPLLRSRWIKTAGKILLVTMLLMVLPIMPWGSIQLMFLLLLPIFKMLTRFQN